MPYTPINTAAFTAAYAGAIAGMAVSGWITDQTSADYALVTDIAGAFAESFDTIWDSSAPLNDLELAAITAIVQTDFNGRGPGPWADPQFQKVSNWNQAAGACIALVLESDIWFAGQGIVPPIPGGGGPLSNVRYVDGGTTVPSPAQTGAIEAPFSTVQAGIDDCPANGTVLVTYGDYSSENILISKILTLQKIGLPTDGIADALSPSIGDDVSVGVITVTTGITCQLNGIDHVKLIGEDNSVTISIANCTNSAGDGTSISNQGGATYPTVKPISSTILGTVNANFLQAINSLFAGNINIAGHSPGGSNANQQCYFSGGCSFPVANALTFDASGANILTMDPVSNANFNAKMTLLAPSGTADTRVVGSDVSQERLTPVPIAASGAGGYTILNNEGGNPMEFDATALALSFHEKLEVGIDATVTDTTAAPPAISELRANRTYALVSGVLTQINDSTVFTPQVVAGNPTIKMDITANVLSLKVYQAAAGGHTLVYVGSLYIKRVTVSS